MAFGSIFTNSARGSCKRRAIETAPRIDTSKSGNSFAANSEAEYTEAPASLTMILVADKPDFFSKSPTNASVSREPVPLPIAIKSTLWRLIKVSIICADCAVLLWGWF